jgi:hypothetical protein
MKRVVVLTGAAPYLGGPSTWLALRLAAPELSFQEIDTLEFSGAQNVSEACKVAVRDAAIDADCVIAHNSAAKPAIEALGEIPRLVPLLLLSPLLLIHESPVLTLFRSMIRTRTFGQLLVRAARSKREKLTDLRYLKKQLSLFIDEVNISDSLLQEALQRVRDPRTALVVDNTAKVFLEVTASVDPSLYAKVQNRTILVGNAALDRKIAQRLSAVTLAGVRSSPMIEAPKAVAHALRELLDRSVRTAI